jgi:chitinase
VTDAQGRSWGADVSYTGGTAAVESTPVSIANTDSPVLYNGQRYGNPSFSYAFPVPNGTYTVTLKFAELYVAGPGQRLFDIVLDGTTVESAFDIYATAGAMNTAVDRSYPVTVSNAQIKIDFSQGTIQFPKVDAIQIAQGSPDGGP